MSTHKAEQISDYAQNNLDLSLERLPELGDAYETISAILDDGVCDQAYADAAQRLLDVKAHIKAIWAEHNLV